jgi:gamma-glutamyltranspeptidase/glutathione hydrolase
MAFRDAMVTLQPPVSQAALVGLALRGLEAASVVPVDRAHAAVELVEAAFGHRDVLGTEGAKSKVGAIRLEYDAGRAQRRGGPRGYAHTTAVTTADANGRIVSMLLSVFDDFGSAVLVPEAGYLLNDRLRGFSPEQGSGNSPRPGARPVHTLSPIIVDHGSEVFALATPGADGQVQSLVQLVDGIVTEGSSPGAVLARPRWISDDGRLLVEAGYPDEMVAGLKARGHDVVAAKWGGPLFGAASLAGFDRTAGTVYGATDPRREVWAACV